MTALALLADTCLKHESDNNSTEMKTHSSLPIKRHVVCSNEKIRDSLGVLSMRNSEFVCAAP